MLKRLTLVALFTGSAQLATLLALKFLAGSMGSAELKALGEVDSLINLIINVIALGLLMSSVRNIAISEDWGKEIDHAQQARFTLGLLLMPLAAWGIHDHNYLVFLFAPIFALQADYALYGRSYPVLAAVISFIRVLVPYIGILLALWLYPRWNIAAFLLFSVLIYLMAGVFISRFFKRPYLPRPSFRSLHLYVKSLSLGIVSLSYYFIGLGLITFAVYFYHNDAAIAIAYIGCKVYMIFKGVLRMINQSFIKEMSDHAVQLKVDQLAGLAGFLFFAGVFFFPNSFIRLLLNKTLDFDKHMLVILAGAGLISAIFTSYTTQAILEKKDRSYAVVAVTASLSAIGCCILFSFFSQSPTGVFAGIFMGELVSVAGLLKIAGYQHALQQRLIASGKYILLLAFPLAAKAWVGDTYTGFILGLGLMSAVFLITFYKKLRL
jgi:hypothetical protein